MASSSLLAVVGWISRVRRTTQQSSAIIGPHPEMACVGASVYGRAHSLSGKKPNLRKSHQSSRRRSSLRSQKKKWNVTHPSNPRSIGRGDLRSPMQASHDGENTLNFAFVTMAIHGPRKNENINKQHTCHAKDARE